MHVAETEELLNLYIFFFSKLFGGSMKFLYMEES